MVRRILTLTFALLLASGAATLLAVYAGGLRDERQPADVIIVLGAAEWNGRPSPALRDRLDHAAELHAQGVAPRIITTGGVGNRSSNSEGGVGRDYLVRQKGIPAEAILAEESSTSTVENLRNALALMQQAGLRTAVIVSEPYHLQRAQAIARDLGIAAAVSPSRGFFEGRFPLWDVFYTAREAMALPVYLVTRA